MSRLGIDIPDLLGWLVSSLDQSRYSNLGIQILNLGIFMTNVGTFRWVHLPVHGPFLTLTGVLRSLVAPCSLGLVRLQDSARGLASHTLIADGLK
jgi:hypothetical protein